MIDLTQADMIRAAILSNFLYGALLLARAPGPFGRGAGSTLWVTVTGAVGHLCYASMRPDEQDIDGAPWFLLMLDILLVFASLFVFVLTFPRLSHVVIDEAGWLIGL